MTWVTGDRVKHRGMSAVVEATDSLSGGRSVRVRYGVAYGRAIVDQADPDDLTPDEEPVGEEEVLARRTRGMR